MTKAFDLVAGRYATRGFGAEVAWQGSDFSENIRWAASGVCVSRARRVS